MIIPRLSKRKERGLTRGEIALLSSVYGSKIRYNEVRVYDKSFMRVFPNNRAMAPNGHLYFPGGKFVNDFSAAGISLSKKSEFIHEGCHLY
jgi:hypothetical protein